ncbi:hypothetical protein [Falsiroseomonas bella]|uniref:hypothetical protein n=1 Tax=Falsiroseomonas bella TaxID=2184016 RepID=UPI0011B6654C|nr:hypothetical protein [Falsiroseomonas bella]
MSDVAENTVVAEAVRAVASDLVSVQHWRDASFVRLPLIYPSGSGVAVRVDQFSAGTFRVSDNGLAFQEIDAVGAARSFARTAATVTEELGVQRNSRAVFVDAPVDQLYRAIADVAMASWQIADRVYARMRDEDEDGIVDYLAERLVAIFGEPAVQTDGATVVGASTISWEVTATVVVGGKITAFQAVGSHPNSVWRANAAFDDLAALPNPPRLVGVVRSKRELGPRLTLLSRSGARIIEGGQSDTDYRAAAAA